jgi:hypothetical protein
MSEQRRTKTQDTGGRTIVSVNRLAAANWGVTLNINVHIH